MFTLRIFLITIVLLISTSCQSNQKKEDSTSIIDVKQRFNQPSRENNNTYETAYFASGCFWCVEAIFESVKGVKEVVSGYSGGVEDNPTYQEVGSGRSSHAEAVEVYYNPNIVSYFTLVQVFFGSHDPTTLNSQGPDRGAQYRSIAFYENEEEKQIIETYIEALIDQKVYGNETITTQVLQFSKFWIAEDYHQDYEKNHPNNSYIKNVSIPRLNRFKKNFGSLLKNGKH